MDSLEHQAARRGNLWLGVQTFAAGNLLEGRSFEDREGGNWFINRYRKIFVNVEGGWNWLKTRLLPGFDINSLEPLGLCSSELSFLGRESCAKEIC